MDSTITALALVGFAVGVKQVGTMIARRRGLASEVRWDEFTESFRKYTARACMTFVASGFYAFIATAALRFVAQHKLSITISEDHAYLFFGLPVALAIAVFLWPKTLKLAS